MVVDDQPSNLRFVERLLIDKGYRVRCFTMGRQALAAAAAEPPDLVLLDIGMPNMNGFEVCEQLKASALLKAVPVIFVSGHDEPEEKLRAFRAGGVDYVVKPYDGSELNARLTTHLTIKRLQGELEAQNSHLEDLVGVRTQELAEANRKLSLLDSAKSAFLQLIAHELRTPLNGILGVGELALLDLPEDETTHELRSMFGVSRERMLSVLNDAELLSEIELAGESVRLASVSVEVALGHAVEVTSPVFVRRNITLTLTGECDCHVRAEGELLRRALQALLTTAAKLTKHGGRVSVEREAEDGQTVVRVVTDGPTLPEKSLDTLFDVLTGVHGVQDDDDLGLDPPVAFRIVSLFGGSMRVGNAGTAGVEIVLSLACIPA
jgi:DNA-binding response OmpR family regulator/nucleotide-binding universal stress UspA family protein